MLNASPVTRLVIPVGVFWNIEGYRSGRYDELACIVRGMILESIWMTYISSRSSIAPFIASGAVMQDLEPRSLIRRALWL